MQYDRDSLPSISVTWCLFVGKNGNWGAGSLFCSTWCLYHCSKCVIAWQWLSGWLIVLTGHSNTWQLHSFWQNLHQLTEDREGEMTLEPRLFNFVGDYFSSKQYSWKNYGETVFEVAIGNLHTIRKDFKSVSLINIFNGWRDWGTKLWTLTSDWHWHPVPRESFSEFYLVQGPSAWGTSGGKR